MKAWAARWHHLAHCNAGDKTPLGGEMCICLRELALLVGCLTGKATILESSDTAETKVCARCGRAEFAPGQIAHALGCSYETPRVTLVEIERLIEWHRIAAGVKEQTDDFVGARMHRERLRVWEAYRLGSSEEPTAPLSENAPLTSLFSAALATLVTDLREARKSLEQLSATSFDGAVSLYVRAADAIERLQRERVAPEWRPIDTAPENCRWVLVWWPAITDVAIIGYRDAQRICGWRSPVGSFDGYSEHDRVGGKPIGPPTHWMPLPERPT